MQSLRNHFLLAMPHLEDPNFAGSLSYLCDHDENGTMGIIVNHPLDLTLDVLLEQVDIDADECPVRDMPVYYGGPTHKDRGFILHRGSSEPWDSSIQVADDVALTTSMDILHALATGKGPDTFMICLGCCGWEAGQLENELKENTWLTVEAEPGIIFDMPPEQRLTAAAGILGIDLNLLTSQIGHS